MFWYLLLVLCTLRLPSIYFASAFKITGATGGIDARTGISPSRLEINQFATSGASFDLYVLALQKFQSTAQTDPLSYFQIAGIHGYPPVPWDGVFGPAARPGYCVHASVLFPMWHRPYLALFEQILWTHAQVVAATYPPDQRARYQAAALTLRIPYWDWAVNATLPDALAKPIIKVNGPSGYHPIDNPLYSYRFHPGPEGNGFPSDNALSHVNYTLRQPNSYLNISDENAVSSIMLAGAASFVTTTYQLLSNPMDYSSFSCTAVSSNSIEFLHNVIHTNIGGRTGGFMYFPEFAAFDPVFWLHHAQVDRLVAIWQALNPNSFVEPRPNNVGSYYESTGTLESANSPLAPFHSDSGSLMFTAASIRNTASVSYTYPELSGLPGNAEQQQMTLRSKINYLYNPGAVSAQRGKVEKKIQQATSFAAAFAHVTLHTAKQLEVNNLDMQWSVRVGLDQNALNRSFTIDFFMGESPNDVKQWATAPNLIGTYGAFVAASANPSTYAVSSTIQLQGEVSLTHTLAAGMSRGYLDCLSAYEVVPLLRQHLHWRASGAGSEEIDLAELSGLVIAVRSQVVRPSQNASDFPIYGEYQIHPEATAGKIGGVSLEGDA